jgi:hypothetical protein
MAWTNIDNALVSVGALPFATTIQALRDNPIAIANGDAGAPKVQNAGLATINAAILATDAAMVNFVLARTAGASVGAVGTYATLRINPDGSTNEGGTRAGSDLRYSDGSGSLLGGTPSGTWMAMGRASTATIGFDPPVTTFRATTWLRIA